MKKAILLLVVVAAVLALAPVCLANPNIPDIPPDDSAPDSGTSAALLSIAVGGLAFARRFFRR